MALISNQKILGRGWGYPIEPGGNGIIAYSEDEEKIRQSIFIILGTARGERVMRPEFGSRLSELVFAPINANTKSLITLYVTNALVQWEPRIDVVQVYSEEDFKQQALLNINIDYKIRATNSMYNLVYPFYLEKELKL